VFKDFCKTCRGLKGQLCAYLVCIILDHSPENWQAILFVLFSIPFFRICDVFIDVANNLHLTLLYLFFKLISMSFILADLMSHLILVGCKSFKSEIFEEKQELVIVET